MNTIYFSTGWAIALTLLAAAMWGGWMQVVKHIGSYPVSGLVFLLYTIAFFIVWGLTFALAPVLIPEGLIEATRANLPVLPKLLLGGGMMSVGILLSLKVLGRIGLLLATTLSGAIGSILGVATSLAEEGIPNTPGAVVLIIITTATFILAGFVCSMAASIRDRDRAETEGIDVKSIKTQVSAGIVALSVLSTFLINGWSVGTAAGTAAGTPPILTAAFLATGSFISIAVYCGIRHTIKKEWPAVFCIGQSKKPLLFSIIAAFCHYGGNLLSIYAMPVLSATLSFLFGRTLNVWGYFWGFYYKEFAGSKRRTKAILYFGILMFFIGLGLLGFFNY